MTKRIAIIDKQRSMDSSSEDIPEAEASSTSSLGEQESIELLNDQDPYADVRIRLEELSAKDKAILTQERQDDDEPKMNNKNQEDQSFEHQQPLITTFAAVTTYLGYAVLIVCGHVRDIFARLVGRGRYIRKHTDYPSDDLTLYATLLKSWENFYTRRIYHRIQDCFNRPLASNPGSKIHVLMRTSHDGNKTMNFLEYNQDQDESIENTDSPNNNALIRLSHNRLARSCLNLGSYNYLGFADETQDNLSDSALDRYAITCNSNRREYGTTDLHCQLERLVAQFLNKEDALALNMGFNTNATTIPALVTRGDLIVSDKLNHSSIVNGARASGAAIRTFAHNDTRDLERILREAIVKGRPRTRRPWNKILVIVEGIYSMEGEYSDLKNIVRVAKQYGAYVYLDEAHSIGAVGATGRGCSEYCGVDTKDIDIMMGTFTKSFAGMGGYIAASKEIINHLRKTCAQSAYHTSLSPVVCQQIINCLKIISGQDGTDIGNKKLRSLRDNSNYFRMRLTEMGFHVVGHYDSPVIPIMLYNPNKIAAFSRECLKRGLAVVVVGFPAVPVLMERARFCISASHTRNDLDLALKEIDEIADILKLRYGRSTYG